MTDMAGTADIVAALDAQNAAGRAEVHGLYEPMVRECRAAAADCKAPQATRDLAQRLMDLIGSRS